MNSSENVKDDSIWAWISSQKNSIGRSLVSITGHSEKEIQKENTCRNYLRDSKLCTDRENRKGEEMERKTEREREWKGFGEGKIKERTWGVSQYFIQPQKLWIRILHRNYEGSPEWMGIWDWLSSPKNHMREDERVNTSTEVHLEEKQGVICPGWAAFAFKGVVVPSGEALSKTDHNRGTTLLHLQRRWGFQKTKDVRWTEGAGLSSLNINQELTLRLLISEAERLAFHWVW